MEIVERAVREPERGVERERGVGRERADSAPRAVVGLRDLLGVGDSLVAAAAATDSGCIFCRWLDAPGVPGVPSEISTAAAAGPELAMADERRRGRTTSDFCFRDGQVLYSSDRYTD